MATFDLEEQEQLSELKLFWQQNGKFILYGITGVLVVMALWQGWNWHVRTRAEEANVVYGKLITALADKKFADAKTAAGDLLEKFPRTQQASLAALVGASAALEAKDPALVQNWLQAVVDKTLDAGLRDIATLRLAALLLDEKNYDAAQAMLARGSTPEFAYRFADLKGDVLAASGNAAGAVAAWKQSVEKLDALPKDTASEKQRDTYRELLNAKIETAGS